MNYFAGLDVSLELTSVCAVDGEGGIVREAQVLSEPDALVAFFGELDVAMTRICLEAGPLSQWLHDGLAEAGLPVVCAETRQLKAVLSATVNKSEAISLRVVPHRWPLRSPERAHRSGSARGRASGSDHDSSGPSTSDRSASTTSSRIDMRTLIAHVQICYQPAPLLPMKTIITTTQPAPSPDEGTLTRIRKCGVIVRSGRGISADVIYPPRRILAIEAAFPVSSQGPEPDILFRLVELPVPVVAPAPLGGADMDPARCPVDRAGISRGLDECLDEHGRGVVALGPVLGQARRMMARMCEPRLGILTQGRIRNLGLSTTRGRFLSRSCGQRGAVEGIVRQDRRAACGAQEIAAPEEDDQVAV